MPSIEQTQHLGGSDAVGCQPDKHALNKPVFGVATGRYDAGLPCDCEPGEAQGPIEATEIKEGQPIAPEGFDFKAAVANWWPSRPR